MEHIVKHIWPWLAHESTTDHVSLVVAALAFVVAVWAGYQSKRTRVATEKQARVAAEQLQESRNASDSADRAAKEVKALTWQDITGRRTGSAARVVIGLEEIKLPPIIVREILDEGDYPRVANPDQPKTFNSESFEDRYSYIYYWARGVIINDDTRSIQFIPFGVKIIEGQTSLADGEIKVPPKMHPTEGRYLLAPGKVALFECRIELTVEQWIEIYKESQERQRPSAVILVYPAGDPENSGYTKINFEGCPLWNEGENEEIWRVGEEERINAVVQSPQIVPSKPLTQLMKLLDESGSARDDPWLWDLDPWQRDHLDMW
jgi:hypothetical protein